MKCGSRNAGKSNFIFHSSSTKSPGFNTSHSLVPQYKTAAVCINWLKLSGWFLHFLCSIKVAKYPRKCAFCLLLRGQPPFAWNQSPSIVLVCAPLSGSLNVSEWFTVRCVYSLISLRRWTILVTFKAKLYIGYLLDGGITFPAIGNDDRTR